MGLKYADLCTRCGKMRTRHPSGLCCRCRATTPPSECKFCGGRTMRGSDCCHKCRKYLRSSDDVDAAIAKQQQMLLVLKLHKEGMSYSQIAEAVGMSKSQAYEAYCAMMRLPIDMTPEIAAALMEKDPEED